MEKYKWKIILINLLIILVFFNISVFKKEKIISDGKLILLKLAPKDPRSLMQGDYMILRYLIASNIDISNLSTRGYIVVNIKSNNLANRVRIQKNSSPLNEDEYLIKYFLKSTGISIGAESFFFQEGKAKIFEKAKYGGIKVDDSGNSLVIGLYDKDFKKIK